MDLSGPRFACHLGLIYPLSPLYCVVATTQLEPATSASSEKSPQPRREWVRQTNFRLRLSRSDAISKPDRFRATSSQDRDRPNVPQARAFTALPYAISRIYTKGIVTSLIEGGDCRALQRTRGSPFPGIDKMFDFDRLDSIAQHLIFNVTICHCETIMLPLMFSP